MPRDSDFRELMVAVFPNRFSQDWELSLSTILPRGGSTKVLLERVAGSLRETCHLYLLFLVGSFCSLTFQNMFEQAR